MYSARWIAREPRQCQKGQQDQEEEEEQVDSEAAIEQELEREE